MSRKSDLPFGSEFSPSQIDLRRALEMARRHEGDGDGLEAAIRASWFAKHDTDESNRDTLAYNSRLGMTAYGIIDRHANLTELGQELLVLADDEDALHERLAKHILLNLHGMTLIRCIRDMEAAGDSVNLTTLREALALRNIHYPRGGKHPSMMRLWLARAGVFVDSRWRTDEQRVKQILGLDVEQFGELGDLTQLQRNFLRALANTGLGTPQPANEIARLATATHGEKFPEKSLPKLVLNGLEEAGYIVKTKTTSGRGAKPFLVAPTEKLAADVVEPLLRQLATQTDPKLVALLRRPLSEILQDLDSVDKHVAGLALEALAFRIMRLLDMDYVATRLRGAQTGGAEVDLIFQSARLVFTRWQIQCKNTVRVSLDDVAKEVGLTHFLKSNAVVVVTTGTVGTEARRYANKIMADSNLAVVLIDGRDVQTLVDNPAKIVRIFRREARQAMKLKTLEL